MAALYVSPSKVRPNNTRVLTFTGTGTSWLTSAPTFTPSGLAGVSLSGLTVQSNTIATATATYASNRGTVTWTDSTTAATWNQHVGTLPHWVPRRGRS